MPLAYIDGDGAGVLAEIGGNFLRRRMVEISHRDADAMSRQSSGDGTADAGSGAGHDGALAGQFFRQLSPGLSLSGHSLFRHFPAPLSRVQRLKRSVSRNQLVT